jgi:hypothetical protein
VTQSRYQAYQRLRQLLPVLASSLVGEQDLEVLRQAGEDLLLMRPGEERLGADAANRAADVLGTLVGSGGIDQAQAELLLDVLAGCGGGEPVSTPQAGARAPAR